MRYLKFQLTGVTLMCLITASCQRAKSTATSSNAPGASGHAAAPQHWVQDEQLRTVMAELSLRTRESWPQGLPDDPEASGRPRDETFREAGALAEGLAAAAGRIPKAVEKLHMSAGDRRGFSAEAGRLRDSALSLKLAADQRRVEPMQRALDQINSSCIACHSRYRDFAGVLDSQRASAD